MPDTPALLPVAAARNFDTLRLFEFVLNLQRSLDLNEVANVAVNDGRLLWEVDRVCLALCRGQKTEILAVSGQESVHPRGNLIRSMRRLADHVIAAGEPFKYVGSFGSLPPQLEKPLADFVQESGTRFLVIVPLFEPERLVQSEPVPGAGKPRRSERRKIGALIIEQMTSSEPSAPLMRSFDAVVDHVAAAVFNAKTHSAIFLLPIWRSLGRTYEWLRGRRLAVAVVILASVIAFSSALIIVPWNYRVDATGRLMPVIQRDVFAPWDGQVIELMTEDGQRVEAGQVLLRLRNDELAAELVTVENQINEKRTLLASLYAQRDDLDKQGNRDESQRAQGKAMETKVEIEGATLKLGVLKERRERLTVRAPIAGIVTTFQIEQLLLNRPVRRGEVLMQVMDDHAEWHLELEIAEKRIGRILQAQERAAREASAESKTNFLAVEFRLLTRPESSYFATLHSLATRTVTADRQGSVLEGRATLDKMQVPLRTIGANVRARINCERSCLGDVLFGDIIEFAQTYLWW